MKNILILCVAVLALGIGYLGWRYAQPEHYGQAFTGAPAAALQDVSRQGEGGGMDVRIEGTIVRQCPASGCWFYLDDGKGNQLRVEMEKVLPQLPQKIRQRAIVEGRLVMMGDEPVFAGNGVEFRRP